MPDIIITKDGIAKLLNGLKPPQGIWTRWDQTKGTKELSDAIAPILTGMFHHLLNTGNITSDWKHANVAPIFKRGAKYEAANYRPVSLTSICSQLLENVITSNPMTHLETNKSPA